MNKPVALAVPEPDNLGFTSDEVAAMTAAGIFGDVRVALVQGELLKADDASTGFSADEFEAMVGRGGFDDMRVELVRGRLYRMSPANLPHGYWVLEVAFAMRDVLGKEMPLFTDVMVTIANDIVLAPDLVLALHRDLRDQRLLAKDVALAIEIADATLARDLGRKAYDYARADVPHYWVVDINAAVTHVFAEPSSEGYRRHERVRFADPLAIPGHEATITLA